MNEVPAENLLPGTVLRVQTSLFPGIKHWGVVGYGRDAYGYPMVWHSQKSDSLRCTPYLEFSAGQSAEILWVPPNDGVADRVISRLQSKEGLPWHLTEANCEMVVRWAVEDKAVSDQLAVGVFAVLAVVVVFAVASSRG
jgi:hypothetical protein